MDFLIVGLGGSLGAMLRYAAYMIEKSLFPGPLPLATLTVNVLGSLIAGFLSVLFERGALTPELALLGLMGFTGAFTTFSTLSAESWSLLQTGRYTLFALSLILNVSLGVAAVIVGRRLGMVF